MKKLLLSLCAVIVATIAFAAEQTASFTTTNKALPATQGQITITPDAGTGNTPGGSSSAQYRLYSGNTMTISATSGYAITNVTSTASSDGYILSSAKASVNEGTVVNNGITLASPVQELVLTFTGEVRFKTITVTYTEAADPGKTPVTLTWSKESDALNFGDEFTAPTLSVDPTEAAEAVAYISSNPELLAVDDEGKMTLVPNVEGTAIVTASIAADNETYTSNTATYTLTVKDPNSPAWYRVDNEKLVVTGVPYAITGGDNKNTENVCAVLTTVNSTYFNVNKEVAMQADKSIETLPEGTLLFTLEEATTEGKYYIKSGDDYLYYNNSGNSASLGSTKGEYTVTYNAETGFVTLQTGSRYLGYNPSASRFAHYNSAPTTSSSSNQPLRLYYKNGSIVEKTPSQLEYSATEWSVMEGTTDMTGAPELTNALGIEVVYSSSDEEVAMLEDNGEIVLMGKVGTTVITATPADTDTYSGSASFTLTVTEKPKTPSQLAWSATEWSVMEGTTDMAGAPELTNALGIEVVYSSSDEEVAMIDEDGTIVLMDKVGSTVITAAPADTDTYSGAVSYTLTVTAKPVLGAITINGTAVEDGQTYTFTEGTELVFAAENAEMMEIEAVTDDNTTAFEFLDEAATATWTNAAIGSYTVSVETTGFGQENSALFTIVVTEKPETIYTKVTSADELVDGAQYVLVSIPFVSNNINYGVYAMGAIKSTNKGFDAVAIDEEATELSEEYDITDENISIITLESATEGTWRMKIGNQYLDGTTNKALKLSDNGDNITITVSDTEIKLATATGTIQFYGQNSGGQAANQAFNTYNSAQKAIWLYKQASAKPATPEVPVIEIDGKVITDFEESIDLNRGTKIVTLTAAEGHHIYHKHVESPATEAASLYAAEPADDFTHVASNVATTEISTNGTLHFYAQHAESGMKSAVQTLTFHGDSTAIFEIEAAESAASEWFDLQGRRVAAPAKGGVYILKQGSKVSKRAI